MSAPSVPQRVEQLFRHDHGRLVAGLTRLLGTRHMELVEDVVAEALASALRVWPSAGVPDDPRAWVLQVARRKAVDALRRERRAPEDEAALERWAAPEEGAAAHEIADDALRMVCTCCHPTLAPEARVALTLKTLCGFSVPEIARALLADERAVAQRLVRARRRIEELRLPFEVPGERELPRRVDSVLEVLYLMFNEGYAASAGAALVRRDLVAEAVRLAELALELHTPARPKVHALLALMHLAGARAPARQRADGTLVPLADQDRALWDRAWSARGLAHFERSLAGEERTSWHVEAAIAATHAVAPDYASTDWPTLLARYDELVALSPSPVARLNRAVAVAKVHGAARALAELDALAGEPALRSYHLLPATRALLLWSLERRDEAAREFRRALACAASVPERRLLERRLAGCESGAACDRF